MICPWIASAASAQFACQRSNSTPTACSLLAMVSTSRALTTSSAFSRKIANVVISILRRLEGGRPAGRAHAPASMRRHFSPRASRCSRRGAREARRRALRSLVVAELGRPPEFARACHRGGIDGLVPPAQVLRQLAHEVAIRRPGLIGLGVQSLYAVVTPARAGLLLGQDAEYPGVADDVAGGVHPAVFILIEPGINTIVAQTTSPL